MGLLSMFKKKDSYESSLDTHDPNLGMSDPNLGISDQNLGLPGSGTNQLGLNSNAGMPDMSNNQTGNIGLDGLSKPDALQSRHSGFGAGQPMQGTPVQNDKSESVEKNIEILSSKMDLIKAMLESVNQRLANLERIANQDQKPRW